MHDLVGCRVASADAGDQGTLDIDHRPKVQCPVVTRHVLSAGNAQNLHTPVISEGCQEFGRDEEILAGVLIAGDLDHAFVDHPLVAGIHALVDLVNYSERSSS